MIPGLLLAVSLHSCGEDQGASLPELSATELVKKVLEFSHGPLRGGMDRSLLRLRDGKASTTVIAAWLPDRLRMDTSGAVEILVNDIGWRCPVNETPVRMEGRELEAIVQMREFVRGMLLTPLYEMRSAVRSGSEILLNLEGGEQWHLQLRANSLLPASLRGPRGEIRFVDYRDASVTKLPQRVVLEGLGEREIQVLTTGVLYSELLFADPETAPGAALPAGNPPSTTSFSSGRNHQPETPEIQEIRDAFWLVMDDPITWEGRNESVVQGHFALYDQGQTLAGFTGFVEENGRKLMIIPFFPDPDRGSRPFVRREDQTIRRIPAHRALVIYPDRSSLPDAIETGRKRLSDHVRDNALQADGPIRVYPYTELGQGTPTADELASMVVRMEQPIR